MSLNTEEVKKVAITAQFNNPKTVDITSGKKINVPYNTLVGTITVGDVCTDTITGGTGVVVSDNGTSVVLNTLTGFFLNTDALTFVGGPGATANVNGNVSTADNAVTVPYDTLVGGPFQFGEGITDGNTGTTAIVVSDDGVNLILGSVNGLLLDNDVLTGGASAATCAVNGQTSYLTVDVAGADGFVTFTSTNPHEAIGTISGITTPKNVMIQMNGFVAKIIPASLSSGNIVLDKSFATGPIAMEVDGTAHGYLEVFQQGGALYQRNWIKALE